MINRPTIIFCDEKNLIKNSEELLFQSNSYTFYLVSYLIRLNEPPLSNYKKISFSPNSFSLDGLGYILLTFCELIIAWIIVSIDVEISSIENAEGKSEWESNTIEMKFLERFLIDRGNLSLDSIAKITNTEGLVFMSLGINFNINNTHDFLNCYIKNYREDATIIGPSTKSYEFQKSKVFDTLLINLKEYSLRPFPFRFSDVSDRKWVDIYVWLYSLQEEGIIDILYKESPIKYHNTIPEVLVVKITEKWKNLLHGHGNNLWYDESNTTLMANDEPVRLIEEDNRFIVEFMDLWSIKQSTWVALDELSDMIGYTNDDMNTDERNKHHRSLRDRVSNINKRLGKLFWEKEFFYIKSSNIFVSGISIK